MNAYNEVRNFCWSLYYKIKDPESLEEGLLNTFPNDILLSIFRLLNCCGVAHNISLVNKKWNVLSDDAGLLKFLIYKDIVFKPSDWQKHLGLNLEISENQKAWDAFPNDIGKLLKTKSGLKDKPKIAMHKIIWIPENATINNFGQLFKNKNRLEDDYYLMEPAIRHELGDVPHQEAGFVLMRFQPKLYAQKYLAPSEWICGDILELKPDGKYRKPSVLESIVCISAVYFKSRQDSFNLISNSHCEVNGTRVTVSMKLYNEGCYLEGISVKYDPVKVKSSKSRSKTSRSRSGRRGL